jgi:hypothetical protein
MFSSLFARRVAAFDSRVLLHWPPNIHFASSLHALVMWVKEWDSGLWGLNTDVCDHQQTSHNFRLLHGDFLDSLDVTHPILEGIDDLNVLHIRDSVSSVSEIFHIILEALIMLLLDGLQGFSRGWALEVADEHNI